MSNGVKSGRTNVLSYNQDYVGSPVAGYAAPDWVEIDRIGDLDRTNSKASTDVDMRASETTIKVFGNKSRQVSFTYYKRSGNDDVFEVLLDSYENDKVLDIRIGEAGPTVVGSVYDRGPFIVGEMTKSEPIAGVDTFNITMDVADALQSTGPEVPYVYQSNLVVV